MAALIAAGGVATANFEIHLARYSLGQRRLKIQSRAGFLRRANPPRPLADLITFQITLQEVDLPRLSRMCSPLMCSPMRAEYNFSKISPLARVCRRLSREGVLVCRAN